MHTVPLPDKFGAPGGVLPAVGTQQKPHVPQPKVASARAQQQPVLP